MAFSFFRWDALERVKDNLTEAQWDTVRAVMIVGGLAVLGAAGYWGGQPAWAHWQSRQALGQAREFAAKKDYTSMFLALRRATLLAPRDRFVWEETARELAQVGSPEELTAREELTRLSPGNHAVELAYAQDALRFGRYETARAALDAMDDAGKSELAYQRLAVQLAVAQGQPDILQVELARLIALDPANTNARFTYAALRLWGTDQADAQAARGELDRLLADPSVRIRAAIELIGEAARHGTPLRVHQVILRCLAVFAPGTPAGSVKSEVRAWEILLRGLKAAAPPSPTDTGLLARWLADLGRRPEALAWLQSLGPGLRASPPVADLIAQLAAEAKDDATLKASLAAGAWGSWPAEAWNLAIAHRRQIDHPEAGEHPVTWASAIAACGDSLDGLRNLGRLAAAWLQPKDAEAAWLAIIDRAPSVRWAYQALQASYLSRQDLPPLFSLYNRWLEQYPLDDTVAEKWLVLAAVLDHATAAVFERADSLVQTDANAAVAKAAVYWRRGRPWDSEKILLALPDADRLAKAGSFWMALAESDLNHPAAAREALKAALSFPRSPEESALLAAAAKKVRYVPST